MVKRYIRDYYRLYEYTTEGLIKLLHHIPPNHHDFDVVLDILYEREEMGELINMKGATP